MTQLLFIPGMTIQSSDSLNEMPNPQSGQITAPVNDFWQIFEQMIGTNSSLPTSSMGKLNENYPSLESSPFKEHESILDRTPSIQSNLINEIGKPGLGQEQISQDNWPSLINQVRSEVESAVKNGKLAITDEKNWVRVDLSGELANKIDVILKQHPVNSNIQIHSLNGELNNLNLMPSKELENNTHQIQTFVLNLLNENRIKSQDIQLGYDSISNEKDMMTFFEKEFESTAASKLETSQPIHAIVWLPETLDKESLQATSNSGHSLFNKGFWLELIDNTGLQTAPTENDIKILIDLDSTVLPESSESKFASFPKHDLENLPGVILSNSDVRLDDELIDEINANQKYPTKSSESRIDHNTQSFEQNDKNYLLDGSKVENNLKADGSFSNSKKLVFISSGTMDEISKEIESKGKFKNFANIQGFGTGQEKLQSDGITKVSSSEPLTYTMENSRDQVESKQMNQQRFVEQKQTADQQLTSANYERDQVTVPKAGNKEISNRDLNTDSRLIPNQRVDLPGVNSNSKQENPAPLNNLTITFDEGEEIQFSKNQHSSDKNSGDKLTLGENSKNINSEQAKNDSAIKITPENRAESTSNNPKETQLPINKNNGLESNIHKADQLDNTLKIVNQANVRIGVANSGNINQAIDQIVQSARVHLKSGSQEIQVNLKPEFLGMVKIVVENIEQEIRAVLYVERPEVRNAIEGQVNQIQKALQDQNIRMDRVDVQDFSSHLDSKSGANTNEQNEKHTVQENGRQRELENNNNVELENLDNTNQKRDFGYNTIELTA